MLRMPQSGSCIWPENVKIKRKGLRLRGIDVTDSTDSDVTDVTLVDVTDSTDSDSARNSNIALVNNWMIEIAI